jgi:hypothetical protein
MQNLRETAVALAPGIRVTPGALVDVDAREYAVDGLGEAVCGVLSEPVALDTVIGGFSEWGGASRDDVATGLGAFVAQLERRGLLTRNASFLREAVARTTRAPLRLATAIATRHRVPAMRGSVRRYRPDMPGLLRAVVEAHQGVSWLGVALVLGGSFAALVLAPDATVAWLGMRTAVLFGAGYVLLVLLTIVVHEAAHLATAALARATLFCSYARLGAAGITTTGASPAGRMAIAAAGPLIAFAVDGVVALAIRFGPDGFWAHASVDQLRLSAFVAAAALALAQLVCLTPLTADGRQLRDAWRQLRGREGVDDA